MGEQIDALTVSFFKPFQQKHPLISEEKDFCWDSYSLEETPPHLKNKQNKNLPQQTLKKVFLIYSFIGWYLF